MRGLRGTFRLARPGPAARDVTPEATEAVCDKLLDGFGELMRAVSLKVVPTAILSRQIAGVRGRALIVNAIDPEAAAFWRRRGFVPSKDDPFILFRSIADIAASLR